LSVTELLMQTFESFWPEFETITTPLEVLNSQAQHLFEVTNGLVSAIVRKEEKQIAVGQNQVIIHFKIVRKDLPNSCQDLLSVKYSFHHYPAKIRCQGIEIEVKNATEFVLELRNLLQNNQTKRLIETLMAG
jgi:hypothetical protein